MKEDKIVYCGIIEDNNTDIMTPWDIFDEVRNHYNKLKDNVLKTITNFVNPGDAIYIISEHEGEKYIIKEELDSYVIYPEECKLDIRTGRYTTDYYSADEIGKTIFATKEEAEEKLKEQQNEKII